MFKSLAKETEWRGFILIGWYGFHLLNMLPPMGLAALGGGLAQLLVLDFVYVNYKVDNSIFKNELGGVVENT